jgi:hypothetical protein
MDSQRTGSYEPATGTVPTGDRISGDSYPISRTVSTSNAGIETGENVMTVRNRVQWGPIIAGLAAALATFLLLTVLGIAIGASVLDPSDTGKDIGTWAAVWGAISAILSFFVGGWLAAKTAAVGGPFSGLVNGLMVGATGLILLLWLTGSGVGNLFGTVSSNLGDVINVAQDQAQSQGVSGQQAQDQAQQQADQAQQQAADKVAQADNPKTFDRVKKSAFSTFLGLLLPLVASSLGGFLGHNKRRELIEGTG